jgi:hypothetical protein
VSGPLPHGSWVVLRAGAVGLRVDGPAGRGRLRVHVLATGEPLEVGAGDVYPPGNPEGIRAFLTAWRARQMPTALLVSEQAPHRDTQAVGQPREVVDADVPQPVLVPADRLVVDAGSLLQPHLAKAGLASESPEAGTDLMSLLL